MNHSLYDVLTFSPLIHPSDFVFLIILNIFLCVSPYFLYWEVLGSFLELPGASSVIVEVESDLASILQGDFIIITVMCHLTTGIRSEKCVVIFVTANIRIHLHKPR